MLPKRLLVVGRKSGLGTRSGGCNTVGRPWGWTEVIGEDWTIMPKGVEERERAVPHAIPTWPLWQITRRLRCCPPLTPHSTRLS
jgi:hypothetical protein